MNERNDGLYMETALPPSIFLAAIVFDRGKCRFDSEVLENLQDMQIICMVGTQKTINH